MLKFPKINKFKKIWKKLKFDETSLRPQFNRFLKSYSNRHNEKCNFEGFTSFHQETRHIDVRLELNWGFLYQDKLNKIYESATLRAENNSNTFHDLIVL